MTKKEKKREYNRAYYAARREYLVARQAEYNQANRDSVRAGNRRWYKANREEQVQKMRERDTSKYEESRRKKYAQNPEKFLAPKREAYKKHRAKRLAEVARWAKSNPDKVNSISAMRRARKMSATPPWVDRGQLEQAYSEAAFVQWATGVKHHVDHIYPLVHPKFSGLHVPWNLQILTASENARKGNRIYPGVAR